MAVVELLRELVEVHNVVEVACDTVGVRGLNVDDVSAILGLLRVPARQREELLALVRDGTERNWVQIGGKLPGPLRDLIRFENEAVALYNYESTLVPGLLQTGDYARTVIRAGNPLLSEDEVDQMVTTRMSRQALLSRYRGPTLSVIVDEMVLRRPVGEPGVMHGQLQHLLSMAQRPAPYSPSAPTPGAPCARHDSMMCRK